MSVTSATLTRKRRRWSFECTVRGNCFNKNSAKFKTAIRSYKLNLHDFLLFHDIWIKNTDAIKRNIGRQCRVKVKLNVKVKLFLSPWKHMGNGRIPPIILNLGTRCEVNDAATRPGSFTSGETMYSKYHETDTTNFDVLLVVHLSIFISVINQLMHKMFVLQ